MWSRELARRERVQGEVCEAGGAGAQFLVVLGASQVVRVPRPLPGARLWSWVRELGSYM